MIALNPIAVALAIVVLLAGVIIVMMRKSSTFSGYGDVAADEVALLECRRQEEREIEARAQHRDAQIALRDRHGIARTQGHVVEDAPPTGARSERPRLVHC